MKNTLKQWIPGPLKRWFKRVHRDRIVYRAVRQLTSSRGGAPDAAVVSKLLKGWGNEGYAAAPEYLQAISSIALETKGPILECGSGASTILINALAARRGIEVWSLEHSPEWHALIASSLRRCDLSRAKIRLSPLRDYGDFSWYDAPAAQMPKDFGMVICDGPPGVTPGGRYGLLPVCHKNLAKDVVILLDDADRPGERTAMDRWVAEYQATIELRQKSKGSFAVVTFPQS